MSSKFHAFLNHYLSFNGYNKIFDENISSEIISLDRIIQVLQSNSIQYTIRNVSERYLLFFVKPIIVEIFYNNIFQVVIVEKIKNNCIKITDCSLQESIISFSEFLTIWQGRIVIVNDKTARKWHEKIEIKHFILLLTLLVITFKFTISLNYKGIYDNLTIIGIVITILVFLQENKELKSIETFCSDTSLINCDSVLESRGSRLFGLLKISELSFIYFLILLASSFCSLDMLQYYFTLLSLSIIPFSIFYQWRVVKKWCSLCLLIVFVLLSQFTVIIFFDNNIQKINFDLIWKEIILVITVSLSFLFFRKISIKHINTLIQKVVIRKFYRITNTVLIELLNNEKKEIENFNSPISYGNKNAAIKLIIVSSPICKPCKDVHIQLTELSKRYLSEIYIQYCPMFKYKEKNDIRVELTSKLLDDCLKSPNKISMLVDNWYKEENYNSTLAFDITNLDYNKSIMDYFYNFRMSNGIQPKLFISKK